MSDILIPGGGGSATDLDAITATSSDIRTGKKSVDTEGEPVTGILATKSGQTYNVQRYNASASTHDRIIRPAGTGDSPANDIILAAPQIIKDVYISSNLIAGNIKKGVTIQIGDSGDSSRLASVLGTWEGFIPGAKDVYKQGSWGSGYSASQVVKKYGYARRSTSYGFAQDWGSSLSFPSGSPYFSFSIDMGNGRDYDLGAGFIINKAINFSSAGYTTLNIEMSASSSGANVYHAQSGVYKEEYVSGNRLMAEPAGTYWHAWDSSGTLSLNTDKRTITTDVSSVSTTKGYIAVIFIASNSSTTSPKTIYIHNIWFT